MNAENHNFNTPKQAKRLGLRRGSSRLKKSITNSNESRSKLENETPTSTAEEKLPRSDSKVHYKALEQDQQIKTVSSYESETATPKNSNPIDWQRRAVSTNCRPYRLALNKKIREKMTKKRLEFYLANEMEKEDTQEKQADYDQQHDPAADGTISSIELLEENTQKGLNFHQEHLKKVEELKRAISIWKSGFSSALQDLQQKIEPRMDLADLLERLNIPQEMIKYVND